MKPERHIKITPTAHGWLVAPSADIRTTLRLHGTIVVPTRQAAWNRAEDIARDYSARLARGDAV